VDATARLPEGLARPARHGARELFEGAPAPAHETDIGQRVVARNEERAQLVFVEPGKGVTIGIDEHDTAATAALGVHVDAGGRERVNVAIDRARRNFQALG
jgi:hypothetical protein